MCLTCTIFAVLTNKMSSTGMNPSIAFNYFKRIYGEVTELSKRTGYNRFYHLFDYLSAFLFHGVHIRQYVIGDMWRMSNPERSRRITFYRMIKLEKKYNNPKYIHLLHNKRDFNEFFKECIHRGWLFVGDATYEEFKAFVEKYKSIIIKPIEGMKGDGVRKYVYNGEDDAALNQLYTQLHQNNEVVEELIIQHPGMVFGNASVNTIRVMTVCCPNGKAYVTKAILRAGVGDTLVDNYAMGGLIYEVDTELGIVVTAGKTKEGDEHFIHPETDIVMLGYRVPLWEKVKALCVQAAEKLPQVAFVGWDVAITEDGVQMIEGNNSSEYEFYEYLGSSCYFEKIKALLEKNTPSR